MTRKHDKMRAILAEYLGTLAPGEVFEIHAAHAVIVSKAPYHAPSAGGVANHLKMMGDKVERIGSGKYRRK